MGAMIPGGCEPRRTQDGRANSSLVAFGWGNHKNVSRLPRIDSKIL